jgi:hypothetical protein
MFVGVSKSLGGGIRVGVGTRLGSGSKKPSSKELQTGEFTTFLRKVEDDLNQTLIIFIEGNGHDFHQLLKDKTDIDELFKDNEKYTEFITLYNNAKYEIEKILYTGDSGVVAKRAITDVAYTVKDFINSEYPNVTPKPKPKGLISKIFSFIWKSIVIFFILTIIAYMFSDKPQDDSKEKQIEKKSTEKIITTAN